jgi:hypothetical protein
VKSARKDDRLRPGKDQRLTPFAVLRKMRAKDRRDGTALMS